MAALLPPAIGLHNDRSISISDGDFFQLRDFIYQKSGLYVPDSRKYLLEVRLGKRLRELGLKTFGEYYYFLRYDVGKKQELGKLFETMTTNETSFFRNPQQLMVFKKKTLPAILRDLRSQRSKRLRIWSAGCSTGDEPYTLAIILHEVLGAEISRWDIKITANDLSERVLHTARRGVYMGYSLRTTPREIIAKYFSAEEGGYKVIPSVKRLVSFGQINLSDRFQLKRIERAQVVFCRNVLIYFDEEMKKQVIGSFYDTLHTGGYLFIGHSESLHNITRAFQPEQHQGTIIYKKMP